MAIQIARLLEFPQLRLQGCLEAVAAIGLVGCRNRHHNHPLSPPYAFTNSVEGSTFNALASASSVSTVGAFSSRSTMPT